MKSGRWSAITHHVITLYVSHLSCACVSSIKQKMNPKLSRKVRKVGETAATLTETQRVEQLSSERFPLFESLALTLSCWDAQGSGSNTWNPRPWAQPRPWEMCFNVWRGSCESESLDATRCVFSSAAFEIALVKPLDLDPSVSSSRRAICHLRNVETLVNI